MVFSDGWWEKVEGKNDKGKAKKDKAHTITAVVRGRIKNNGWVDQEWIWKADKKFYGSQGQHFGTRIVFDQGYIYFIIGERGGMTEVQELDNPKGKIFRLHDDGRVPDNNPFVDQPGAIKGVWTYGHRNPQGLAVDPRDGAIFSTEHGPRGGDELNLILKGHNYGWAYHYAWDELRWHTNDAKLQDTSGGDGSAVDLLGAEHRHLRA